MNLFTNLVFVCEFVCLVRECVVYEHRTITMGRDPDVYVRTLIMGSDTGVKCP